MNPKRIPIEHRLLLKLIEADKEAALQFRCNYDPGLGGIGLLLTPELRNGGYECTPKNSCSFAHTGGEGVHFSFLGNRSEVNDASPVIVTIPMVAFDHPNFIVGENLFDFLCFGMYRGFFALEQLGYNFEETFTAYTDPNWQPSDRRHDWVGLTVDDQKSGLLRILVERFGLVPWREPKTKFDRLQERYLAKLQIPANTNFTSIHFRRGPQAHACSLGILREHLSQSIGVLCKVEQLPDGPWVALEGCHTNMSMAIDELGSPADARVQFGFAEDPAMVERLIQAFEAVGWELYKPEENE